ncbi:MAG: polyprenyl synthetase family protein [Gemmatimonadetes bacterium]|nr:polyprenyl synthetase family protein [Gemmatimonadota bacterium]
MVAEEVKSEYAGDIGEAIAYGLSAPGKRFRPALMAAVHRELGGKGTVSWLGAAVEVVHTYSLMHDDLPCMDDDDIRRGHQTAHRKFSVATATEAAMRMVPLAARVLARGADMILCSRDELGRMGKELFVAAGASGMVGGQMMDLEAEGRSLTVEELEQVHGAKTGALVAASAVIGSIAAGADDAVVIHVKSFGEELGLAFQIADDILDATASSDILGKTAGKDARQQKATFATILGITDARARAEECVGRALDNLRGGGIDSKLLSALGRFVIEREY